MAGLTAKMPDIKDNIFLRVLTDHLSPQQAYDVSIYVGKQMGGARFWVSSQGASQCPTAQRFIRTLRRGLIQNGIPPKLTDQIIASINAVTPMIYVPTSGLGPVTNSTAGQRAI